MTDYFHCPRHSIAPKVSDEQQQGIGLCDFCWDEYGFCWAEYCLIEWFESQANRDKKTQQDAKSK